VRQNNPTGKPILFFGTHANPQNKKYSAFPEGQSAAHLGHPVPLRGALAIVSNVGRVAMDADVATDERGKSVWS
jgi:hypothetical protein